jgi:hypothetical protein
MPVKYQLEKIKKWCSDAGDDVFYEFKQVSKFLQFAWLLCIKIVHIYSLFGVMKKRNYYIDASEISIFPRERNTVTCISPSDIVYY